MDINFYNHKSKKFPQITVTKDGIIGINHHGLLLMGDEDFKYAKIGISACGNSIAIVPNNEDGYSLTKAAKHGYGKRFTARLAIKEYGVIAGKYICRKKNGMLIFDKDNIK